MIDLSEHFLMLKTHDYIYNIHCYRLYDAHGWGGIWLRLELFSSTRSEETGCCSGKTRFKMHKLEQSWTCKSARYNGSLIETSDYRCWLAYGLMGLWACANCNLQSLRSISWDIAKCNRIPLLPSRWHEAQPAQPTRGTLKRHVETLQRTVHCLHLPCFARAAFHLNPGLDGHLRRTEDREAGWPEAMGQRGRESEKKTRDFYEIPRLSVDVDVLMSLILAWMKFESRIEIIK